MSRNRPIPGEALLGFSDFFEQEQPLFFHDVLGAGAPPPKRPPPKNNSKTTKVPVRTAKSSGKPSPHKTVLVRTIDAGKKAITAGKNAAAKAQQYAANVKKGQHGPVVPLQRTRVNGDGTVVLGATTARVLTPAQRAAVSKHVNAVAKNAAATKRLAALAKKAQTTGTGALDFSKNAALAIKKAFSSKWRQAPTRVRGFYTTLGLAPPDPQNPGFLTDGSLDPAMSDPTMDQGITVDPYAQMDDGSGAVMAPDGTVLYDPATDPAVVPMPPRGGVLSPDEASYAWQNAPEDGIAYDGSRGLPVNSVGSWNVFYGTQKNGDGWGVPGFLRGTADGSTILWMYAAPETNNDFKVAPASFQSTATSGAPECKGVSSNSQNRGWGVIVGNPRDSFLASLQFAVADGVWFWQGKNAPIWATQEADSKIALANQKIIAANRAAALVEQARLAADAAAMSEAQAKQDAANALAQSAADQQSQIIQQQLDSQQGQLDMQQQKAELDYQTQQSGLDMQTQQAILEDAKRQAAMDAEAQHQLIEQTGIWNKYAQEHPDEAVAQMQQQQEGAEGDGLDDGAAYDEFSDGNPGSLDDFSSDLDDWR